MLKHYKIFLFTSLCIFLGIIIILILYFTRKPNIGEQNAALSTSNGITIVENNITGFYTIKAPSSVSLDLFLKASSEKAGFKIYYPIFIPSEIKSDVRTLETDSTVVNYNLGDRNSSSPWIGIVEAAKSNNVLSKRADSFESKNEVNINGNTAYLGTTEVLGNKFNNLIYSTPEGTTLWFRSKAFGSDVLMEIAKSMQ